MLKNIFSLNSLRIFSLIIVFLSLIALGFSIYLLIFRPDLTSTTGPYSTIRDSLIALSSLAMVFATGFLAYATFTLASENNKQEDRYRKAELEKEERYRKDQSAKEERDRKERLLNEMKDWSSKLNSKISSLIPDFIQFISEEHQMNPSVMVDICLKQREVLIEENINIKYFISTAVIFSGNLQEALSNLSSLIDGYTKKANDIASLSLEIQNIKDEKEFQKNTTTIMALCKDMLK
jgi:hypothetical protein